jgi:hypothetical protein
LNREWCSAASSPCQSPSSRRPVGQRVPAQAHGRVNRRIRRPTSSLQAPYLPALRRRGGGGGSPPRRQHRSEATTGRYYEATTRANATRLLQATTRLLAILSYLILSDDLLSRTTLISDDACGNFMFRFTFHQLNRHHIAASTTASLVLRRALTHDGAPRLCPALHPPRRLHRPGVTPRGHRRQAPSCSPTGAMWRSSCSELSFATLEPPSPISERAGWAGGTPV